MNSNRANRALNNKHSLPSLPFTKWLVLHNLIQLSLNSNFKCSLVKSEVCIHVTVLLTWANILLANNEWSQAVNGRTDTPVTLSRWCVNKSDLQTLQLCFGILSAHSIRMTAATENPSAYRNKLNIYLDRDIVCQLNCHPLTRFVHIRIGILPMNRWQYSL